VSQSNVFKISKHQVCEAYRQVKANRGSSGIDGQTIEQFEQNLHGNLYKIWNRLSSGSYFPPPVKRVEIAKSGGGTRALGIPTVSDRIAQMVAKLYLEPYFEPHFHGDSYGYRPNKSAHQAVEKTRQRCWQYEWLVEFDIKGAFDQIDHKLLIKALEHHQVPKWTLLYVKRWLTAPFETAQGQRTERTRGVPQGGVVSPLLMNVFMHYAYDAWMVRSYPHCPFARYADDAVCHCRTEQEAKQLYQAIEQRLADCGLQMHPEKSRIVHCKRQQGGQQKAHTSFTFLGFDFQPRMARNKHGQVFVSYLPAVSQKALKAMRTQIRQWALWRYTPATLEEFAERYARQLQGWWAYYGKFYGSRMDVLRSYLREKLERWVRRKYKRFRRHKRRSREYLWRYVTYHAPQLKAFI
jgi:group II intron reverse transcriptase/maturase